MGFCPGFDQNQFDDDAHGLSIYVHHMPDVAFWQHVHTLNI